MCSGPLVSFRSFKTSAPNRMRHAMKAEFLTAITKLDKENAGVITSFRAARAAHDSIVFVKSVFLNLPSPYKDTICRSEYNKKFESKINKLISPAMRQHIYRQGMITMEQVES